MNIFENTRNKSILDAEKERKKKERLSHGSPRADAVYKILGEGGIVIAANQSATTVKTLYGTELEIT